MISQNCNRRFGSSSRRTFNSLGRYGFKLSLRIKRRNDVLGKDSPLAARHVDFFGLLTNVIGTLISFSSVIDILGRSDFGALATEPLRQTCL